jgi:hypothetical protein
VSVPRPGRRKLWPRADDQCQPHMVRSFHSEREQLQRVNADSKVPKSAEVKFPSYRG